MQFTVIHGVPHQREIVGDRWEPMEEARVTELIKKGYAVEAASTDTTLTNSKEKTDAK